MMYDDGKLLKGAFTEPWARRKARGAAARAEGIAQKAAELAETYARLRLPIPMRLTPKPLPEPKPAFIPYRITRERGATGRRDSARATAIRGSRIGRPPSAARQAAIASGHRTYQGRPCPHGHDGMRFVNQNVCVECARLRREAKRKGLPRRLTGAAARASAASAQESLRRA